MLLGLLLATTLHADQESFQFRSDFRPSFTKSMGVAELKQLQVKEEVLILDVRLEEDYTKNPERILGSVYRNPESLPSWIDQIDRSKEVVVYCVAGKWVSQKVAHLLDEAGITVRSLQGGLDAWNASLQE